MKNKFKITKEKVWLWPSENAAWHFVYVSRKISEEIKKRYSGRSRGFGSLPVEVTIGKTKWQTSIFPESKTGTYLLPLKSEIRKKENITEGDILTYILYINI